MLKAFTYMFQDNKFFLKSFFCVLLSLIISVADVLLDIFTEDLGIQTFAVAAKILFQIPLWGYLISCIKAIRCQNNLLVLPYINGNAFSFGAHLVVFSIIIGILFGLLMRIPILGLILGLFFIITLMILLPAFYCNFADNEFIGAFFAFGKAIEMIKRDVKTYALSCLMLFVTAIINLPVILLLSLSVHPKFFSFKLMLLSVLIDALLTAYLIYVDAYLVARSTTSENSVKPILVKKVLKF